MPASSGTASRMCARSSRARPATSACRAARRAGRGRGTSRSSPSSSGAGFAELDLERARGRCTSSGRAAARAAAAAGAEGRRDGALLRAARRGRAEPELAARSATRGRRRSLPRRRGAEDDARRVRPRRAPGDAARPTSASIGSGAGGARDRGRARSGRPHVVVLERGGLPQRGGLPAARARRRPGAVPARRALLLARAARSACSPGSTLGGGHGDQLDGLPAAAGADPAEWAALGLDGIDGPDVRRAPRRGLAADQRQHRGDEAEPDEPDDARGARARAASHGEMLPRNASLDDDPRYCGYCNAGCQQGCKQSTLKTYLQDAADAGAAVRRRLRRRPRARRGRPGGGRPARTTGADGEHVELTRRGADGGRRGGRDRVARAPAALAASAGPRPASTSASTRPTSSAASTTRRCNALGRAVPGDRLASTSPTSSRARASSSSRSTLSLAVLGRRRSPFSDGAAHKERMLRLRHVAPGTPSRTTTARGEVVLGAGRRAGRPLGASTTRSTGAVAARAHVELARLHRARGARRDLHLPLGRPRAGARATTSTPTSRGSRRRRTSAPPTRRTRWASCRLGADPATLGRRRLRASCTTSPGVWIGDASALPTAPGVNPMLTIMALARRTAHAIRDGAPPTGERGIARPSRPHA